MKRTEFSRVVRMLAGSAVLAHGLTAAALPVLSRLYSPTDFSALAAFSGLLSVLAVVATLRFDIAIPIPEDDRDALTLLTLAVGSAAIMSVVIAIPIVIFPSWIAMQLNQPQLEPYLLMLPLGIFLASSYSALQSWFIRTQGFPVLAWTRVAQSASSAGTQVGLGFLSLAPFGLIVGQIMNSAVACATLGVRLAKGQRDRRSHAVTWWRMRSVAGAYSRFPKYSTLEALCNTGSMQVPIVLIAAVAVGPEAGYLILAMTLMQAPMSLIGSAIGQVYLSRASEEYRVGCLSLLTTDTLAYLLKVGIGPLIAAGIVSPVAFGMVFGPDWHRAGLLVFWMTPWFALQFAVVPIAMALHVTGHQKHAFGMQFFGLAVRVLAVVCAANWFSNGVAEAYAVSGLFVYAAYLWLVLSVTKVSPRQAAGALVKSLPYVMGWIVLGATVTVALRAI